MTPEAFRRAALKMPGSTEGAHMGHPDFRVGGKVFASLSQAGEGWAMVKLSPASQAAAVHAYTPAFVPVQGAWGRAGATYIHLAIASAPAVRAAIKAAWENVHSRLPQKRRTLTPHLNPPKPGIKTRAKPEQLSAKPPPSRQSV